MASLARRTGKEEKDDVLDAYVMAQVVELSCIIRVLFDVRCFWNTCLANAFTIHSSKNDNECRSLFLSLFRYLCQP